MVEDMGEFGTGSSSEPDAVASSASGSKSRSRARIAAVGAGAALVVGVGGIAVATSGSPSPSTPGASPSPSASPSAKAPVAATGPPSRRARRTRSGSQGRVRRGGPGGFGSLGGFGVVHGTYVVAKPGGGYQTVQTQTGTVKAVSATSLSVTSKDGFAFTYVVKAGTNVDAQRDGIASVKKGDQVLVRATLSGKTATVTRVVDLTRAAEERAEVQRQGRRLPRSRSRPVRIAHPRHRHLTHGIPEPAPN